MIPALMARTGDGTMAMMKVAQVAGWSGAGKTTLITALIRLFVARGERVGAIKHTHHPLNDGLSGDTGRFSEAGASLVMLAGDGEAVLGGQRVRYGDPSELLAQFAGCDVVIVEGFKRFEGWPRIDVNRDDGSDPADAAAILDRIWRSSK
jgi:molybdopterin-guanine dinucleotide biosynthesis protein B